MIYVAIMSTALGLSPFSFSYYSCLVSHLHLRPAEMELRLVLWVNSFHKRGFTFGLGDEKESHK